MSPYLLLTKADQIRLVSGGGVGTNPYTAERHSQDK